MGLGKLKFKTGNWLMKVDNKSSQDLSIKEIASHDSGFSIKNNKTSPIEVNFEKEKELQMLQQKVRQMSVERESYEVKVKEGEKKQTEKNERIQILEKELDGLLNKIKLLENKLQVKQEFDMIEESNNLQEVLDEKEELSLKNMELEEENKKLLKQMDDITTNYMHNKKRVENLTFKETELSEIKASLTLERDQLKVWLKEEKDQNDSIRLELAELKAVYKLNLVKVNELENTVKENKNNEEDLSKIQELEEKVQKYEKDIQNYKKENQDLKDKVEQFQVFLSPIIKEEVKKRHSLTLSLNNDNSENIKEGSSMNDTPLSSPTMEYKENEESELDYLNNKLDQLMEEKKKVTQAYSKIPISKVTKTLRLKQYELEQQLDSLDSKIAGVRNRLKVLMI